ncbi:MAG TPA: alpha/beta fold hydrolase, partial [Thermoanaerobaculia bacterium]|nr:alpha/beta fold hydrolase [Thermoanaerobaculia bacterium]
MPEPTMHSQAAPARVLLAAILLVFIGAGGARAGAANVPAATDAQPASGYVQIAGGRLYYEVLGQGPPLVFLHDGLVHSVTWDGQFPVFARKYRAIRYDRRGYGRTESGAEPYSDVDDLLAVFDALKVDRAVLVGASSGGGLAVDFTLAHPDRVSALVLVGAVVGGLDYSEHFLRRSLANLRPTLMDKDLAKTIEAWANDPYLTAPESTEVRRRLREIWRQHPGQVQSSGPRPRPAARPALPRLAEIRVPTLLVTGASDIPDVHAHAGALNAGIAGSRRVVIPGSGHLVHLERPEEFNAAVMSFLRPEDDAVAYLAKLAGDRSYEESRRLFDYDDRAPLDVREAGSERRGDVRVVDLSYVSPAGGRVPAFLVLPAAAGRQPAALFLHSGQGDRSTFLDEAVALAGRGMVSLLVGAPHTRPEAKGQPAKPWDAEADRKELIQTVVDLRRGLDLLASRPEVDTARLAYVGHSLGATAGGVLAGIDQRVSAYVLMAGLAAQSDSWMHGHGTQALAFQTLLSRDRQEGYVAAMAPLDSVHYLPHAAPAKL